VQRLEDLAINTKGLGKRYGHNWAVKDLNLKVKRGSIFGLLGPNGAGKTTTLKMLLGLVNPTEGFIEVLGEGVGVKARRAIGYLPESQSCFGYMRVWEVIRFCSGLYPRWDRELVETYLDMFHLPQDKRIDHLSRGMRSQLGLILALAPRPPILILDEPTAGMDPVAVRKFLGVIVDEAARFGHTVLMSSQVLHQVERVADTVGIISKGRLLVSRPMDDLKTQEKRIRVAFQSEPGPDLFSVPGIVGVEKEGRRYVVTVSDNIDGVLQALSGVPHFALEIVDLDLEEIFLRYAGEDS